MKFFTNKNSSTMAIPLAAFVCFVLIFDSAVADDDYLRHLDVNAVTQNRTNSSSSNILLTKPQSSYSSCSSNSNCYSNHGIHSRCYLSSCICDIGYYPRVGNGYCDKINCVWDSDCYTKQYGTRCSFSNTCTCDYGYYLDYSSQTCLLSGSGSTGVKVGVPVGVVLFLFVIGVIACCTVRNRRNRLVATRVVRVPQPQMQPPPMYAPQQQPQQQPTTIVVNTAAPGVGGYQNPNYVPQNAYYPQQQQQQYTQQQAPPPYNPAYPVLPNQQQQQPSKF